MLTLCNCGPRIESLRVARSMPFTDDRHSVGDAPTAKRKIAVCGKCCPDCCSLHRDCRAFAPERPLMKRYWPMAQSSFEGIGAACHGGMWEELPTFDAKEREVRPLGARNRAAWALCAMARPTGFEPVTLGFGNQYSIQLSYGRASERF